MAKSIAVQGWAGTGLEFLQFPGRGRSWARVWLAGVLASRSGGKGGGEGGGLDDLRLSDWRRREGETEGSRDGGTEGRIVGGTEGRRDEGTERGAERG